MPRFTEEDDALLDELGVEVETNKESSRTPREERVIAGFEEIQRFVEQHGRAPRHGEDRDIFARLAGSSEAGKTMLLAISVTVPMRPIGMRVQRLLAEPVQGRLCPDCVRASQAPDRSYRCRSCPGESS